jgi:hypothetical protein
MFTASPMPPSSTTLPSDKAKPFASSTVMCVGTSRASGVVTNVEQSGQSIGLERRIAGNQHLEADHAEAGAIEHNDLDRRLVRLHGEQLPSSIARPPSPDNETTWRPGWDT